MPIVRLSLALRELEVGEQLCVEARDAAFAADLEAWAKMSGNEIVELCDDDIKRAIVRRLK